MKTFSKLTPILALSCLLFSCEEKESTDTKSAVAQITAFAFEADDSIPGLAAAQFVVENFSDTGLIRMRKNDSVQYKTPIDSIVPKITYYTTPSTVVFYLGDSAVTLTGYDTLNLSIKPIKIHVIAQNTDYDKWYKLEFDVHKVDGDYFHWDTLHAAISDQTYGIQKALMLKNTFLYYQSDGEKIRTFVSNDLGLNWEEQNVSGLPSDCNIRQIVEGDSLLFYGKGHAIYYSSNGWEWSSITTDLNIAALYMCMYAKDVRIWLAASDSLNSMAFYSIGRNLQIQKQTGIGLPGDSLPISFPIEEFATIPFRSSSKHQHALIAGGYNRLGVMTNDRWSLEYNYIYDTYHITNMADENNDLPPFIGSSISYYDNFLYMLGGMIENRQYLNNVYTSIDEGMHWQEVTDSENEKKPSSFSGRFHTNTFVHEQSGNIYIIGGEDNSTTYSDVYRGRVNSIGWPEIGD